MCVINATRYLTKYSKKLSMEPERIVENISRNINMPTIIKSCTWNFLLK